MGKLLVIKGADFSANAVEKILLNVDIALEITLKRGYNRGNFSTSDLNRMGTNVSIDLSEYIALGYNHIKLTPKEGYYWVGMIGNADSVNAINATSSNSKKIYDGTMDGSTDIWRTNGGNGCAINSSFKYLHLGFKKSNDANFSQEEDAASTFAVVELSKISE